MSSSTDNIIFVRYPAGASLPDSILTDPNTTILQHCITEKYHVYKKIKAEDIPALLNRSVFIVFHNPEPELHTYLKLLNLTQPSYPKPYVFSHLKSAPYYWEVYVDLLF